MRLPETKIIYKKIDRWKQFGFKSPESYDGVYSLPSIHELELRIPYFTDARDNLYHGLSKRTQRSAKSAKYISFVQGGYYPVITLDCDSIESAYAWKKLGLPAPNLMVPSRSNGHYHLTWILKHAINHTDIRAFNLYKMVRNGLTKLIGSDSGYTGYITYNPLKFLDDETRVKSFKTEPYENLYGMWKNIEPKLLRLHKEPKVEMLSGRNNTLFKYGFDVVYSCYVESGMDSRGTASRLYQKVNEKNKELFSGDMLPDSEVRDICSRMVRKMDHILISWRRKNIIRAKANNRKSQAVRTPLSNQKALTAYKLKKDGLGYSDIGDIVNCTRQHVYNLIRKAIVMLAASQRRALKAHLFNGANLLITESPSIGDIYSIIREIRDKEIELALDNPSIGVPKLVDKVKERLLEYEKRFIDRLERFMNGNGRFSWSQVDLF